MPIKVMAAPKAVQKLLRDGIEKQLAAGLIDATLATAEGLGGAAPRLPPRPRRSSSPRSRSRRPRSSPAGARSWSIEGGRPWPRPSCVQTRDGLRFGSVSRGPHVAASTAGEGAAERWSRSAKGDYELALLRVPGAYATSLWLRSASDEPDAFVPIEPCPPSLQPNEVYAEARFRAALLPEARKQLDAPPEGGSSR